jgi:hypothetical protein
VPRAAHVPHSAHAKKTRFADAATSATNSTPRATAPKVCFVAALAPSTPMGSVSNSSPTAPRATPEGSVSPSEMDDSPSAPNHAGPAPPDNNAPDSHKHKPPVHPSNPMDPCHLPDDADHNASAIKDSSASQAIPLAMMASVARSIAQKIPIAPPSLLEPNAAPSHQEATQKPASSHVPATKTAPLVSPAPQTYRHASPHKPQKTRAMRLSAPVTLCYDLTRKRNDTRSSYEG